MVFPATLIVFYNGPGSYGLVMKETVKHGINHPRKRAALVHKRLKMGSRILTYSSLNEACCSLSISSESVSKSEPSLLTAVVEACRSCEMKLQNCVTNQPDGNSASAEF